MQCPYFTITNRGAFDSATLNLKKANQDRLLTAYEFEFYTQDCEGGLCIDGVFHPARKGCFTCCKPGQVQRMILPYKCYFFNICTQDEDLCALLDRLPNYSVLLRMEEVEAILKKMLTVENPGRIESRIYMQGCVCQILSILSRMHPVENDADITQLHRKTLTLADKYIREHYAEDITLESLAFQFGLHPNYFHRLYTTAFGKTPAQRLLSCRITAAKTMLLAGNDSISTIASACGFSSQTYFGYKFKQITGYAPLQYRKRMVSKK